MYFVLPNHFGERTPELGRAHRTGERDHHFPAVVQVGDVSISSILDYSRVEVAVMAIDKFSDRPRFFAVNVSGFNCPLLLNAKYITLFQTNDNAFLSVKRKLLRNRIYNR